MKMYAQHGVKEFVLCTGYKSWLFKEFFLNYQTMTTDITVRLGKRESIEIHGRHDEEDWTVTLAETGLETSTAGRVLAVRRYVEGDEPFLLTYGDAVSDLDIRATIDFHQKHGKIASVTAVRPPGRFGEMRMDGSDVKDFNEKPQTTEGFINGGFFVCDGRRFWPYLGAATMPLEREPMQTLVRDGELKAFTHDGFWQPMDTKREYDLLNDLWASGKAPWQSWRSRS
jgi:glucose-1-phosphate cytidylyltransferase